MEKLHQAILEQLLLPEAPLSIAEGRPSISFINVAHKNINLIENEAIAILSSEDGESCTSACAKIGRSCDSLALASATTASAVWRFMPECSSVTVVESNAGNQPQIDVSDQSCTFSTAFSYCDAEADTNRHRICPCERFQELPFVSDCSTQEVGNACAGQTCTDRFSGKAAERVSTEQTTLSVDERLPAHASSNDFLDNSASFGDGTPSCVHPYKIVESQTISTEFDIGEPTSGTIRSCRLACDADLTCAAFVINSDDGDNDKNTFECRLSTATASSSASETSTVHLKAHQWVELTHNNGSEVSDSPFYAGLCSKHVQSMPLSDTVKLVRSNGVEDFYKSNADDTTLCSFLQAQSSTKYDWSYPQTDLSLAIQTSRTGRYRKYAEGLQQMTLMIGKKVTSKISVTPHVPSLGVFRNGNRPSASEWIQSVGYSFTLYIKRLRPRKIKAGKLTFRDCQLLCLRDSTCNGLRHNGHVCDLLIDPTCDYMSSFTATGAPGEYVACSISYRAP